MLLQIILELEKLNRLIKTKDMDFSKKKATTNFKVPNLYFFDFSKIT